MQWLKARQAVVTTACGATVPIYDFAHVLSDDVVMTAWAKHFRNHYCDDDNIDYFRSGPDLSRKDYLITLKFPSSSVKESYEKTGPATRSGDFAEILVADYLSSHMSYWVPRIRYELKFNKNTSEQGSDVVAMKFDPTGQASADELIVFEVKAALTGVTPVNRLQDAVAHSDKDKIRLAESLNAMRERLFLKNQLSEANDVQRFQNPKDKPYQMKYGAAAVLTEKVFDISTLCQTNTSLHANQQKLTMVVICGKDMMDLVHKLYERAANEA